MQNKHIKNRTFFESTNEESETFCALVALSSKLCGSLSCSKPPCFGNERHNACKSHVITDHEKLTSNSKKKKQRSEQKFTTERQRSVRALHAIDVSIAIVDVPNWEKGVMGAKVLFPLFLFSDEEKSFRRRDTFMGVRKLMKIVKCPNKRFPFSRSQWDFARAWSNNEGLEHLIVPRASMTPHVCLTWAVGLKKLVKHFP